MTTSRPYLVRAIHEWILDNEMTPHLLVDMEGDGVDVPAALCSGIQAHEVPKAKVGGVTQGG